MKKIVLSLLAGSMLASYGLPTYVSAAGFSDGENSEFNSNEEIVLENDIQEDEIATEEEPVITESEENSDDATDSQKYTIEYEEDGPVIVVYEENIEIARAVAGSTSVSKWGAWGYTHISISRGVLSGAINTAFYTGIGAVAGTIGLPVYIVSALLNSAQWTKLGSTPGKAVAKKWDTSGNGWVEFYMSKGYNAAGKHVATKYKTK
ncbi:hypothetical protein LHA31_07710 [Carnobacterium viridans]|uniref:Uncharacterized protein n=1 Tax=Carnobacterium viridans TaxID=174587 RepID=A0A1H0ZSH5_9LACT|nr:hypothetical protein [Carnobacterium viridans]UDE94493.1 hypothetical protein LHA31_07710 [Carnobacterium viridans]SDQ30221.1 hypothetical protein SAMN04487752_1685 [Carnobacterium viridans]